MFSIHPPCQFSALSSSLCDMSNGSSLWRHAKPFCLTCFEISSCYLKTSSSKDLDITWPKEKKKCGPTRKNWKSSHAQEKHYALAHVTLRLFILILKGELQEGDKFVQYRICADSGCMMEATPGENSKTCIYFPCNTTHFSFIPTIIYITYFSLCSWTMIKCTSCQWKIQSPHLLRKHELLALPSLYFLHKYHTIQQILLRLVLSWSCFILYTVIIIKKQLVQSD